MYKVILFFLLFTHSIYALEQNTPEYDSLHEVGIDYFSGGLCFKENDHYAVSNISLRLTRTYNSFNDYLGTLLGTGWAFWFESKIVKFEKEDLVFFDAELSRIVKFKQVAQNKWKYRAPLYEKFITKEKDGFVLKQKGCSCHCTFNTQGKLVKTVNGQSSYTHHYDEEERLVKIVKHDGTTLHISYYDDSLTLQVYDANKKQAIDEITYTLSTNLANKDKYLLSVSTKGKKLKTYLYNHLGDIIRIKDLNIGNFKTISYNKKNRVVAITSPYFISRYFLYNNTPNHFTVYSIKASDGKTYPKKVELEYYPHKDEKRLKKISHKTNEMEPNTLAEMHFTPKGYKTLYIESLNGITHVKKQYKFTEFNKLTYVLEQYYGDKFERHFIYNSDQHIKKITSSEGLEIKLYHDAKKRVSKLETNTTSILYGYDEKVDKPSYVEIAGIGKMDIKYDKDGNMLSHTIKAINDQYKEGKKFKILKIFVDAHKRFTQSLKVDYEPLPSFIQCH